jgi:RHS repeat-associated protein
VTYEYSKDSKITKMKDETGTTESTWDKLDRLTEYKNGAGKTVKYEYNLGNLPTKITYPNGESVTREYDKDNRLSKVTDWKGNSTIFKYDADSEPTSTAFPSGTENKDEYVYNEDDLIKEVSMLKGGVTFASIAYKRNGDWLIKSTTSKGLLGPEASESVLDENNRLIEASKRVYEYDKANNPSEIEGEAGYTYNEADELKEGPAAKYTYNEDGERTKLEPKSGEPATSYGYDQSGNLTSIERAKGTKQTELKESYTYDGNNLRQTQTINGTKTNLTWDTAEAIPIVLSDETYSYIYGPGNLPIEQITGTTATYVHHDQQGSTRVITNSTGEIAGQVSYGPYGNIKEATSIGTRLEYDGQYTDNETGFVYLRARTYDPATAQFLSVDPALEGTGEPYSYVSDDPGNGIDPSGKCGTTAPHCSAQIIAGYIEFGGVTGVVQACLEEGALAQLRMEGHDTAAAVLEVILRFNESYALVKNTPAILRALASAAQGEGLSALLPVVLVGVEEGAVDAGVILLF